MLCLGVGLFGFILFGTLCASCTRIAISFFRKFWEVFSYYFIKYIFNPLFFLFPLESLLCIDWHALYFSIDLILLSFFFHLLSVCCPDWVISIILSSRSLILSSALFILFFIAFSSTFVLANEFSSFSRFLLIISSSFLQYSAFLSIDFICSFSIFISSFWNWCLLNWRGLFHCLFFQGNYLGLLTERDFPASFFSYISLILLV